MYNFQSLPKKDWVTDNGFRKALAADLGTMTFGGQPVARGRQDIVGYWPELKVRYRS